MTFFVRCHFSKWLKRSIHSTNFFSDIFHDVIRTHFPHYWPFVGGVHSSLVNSPSQRATVQSFIVFLNISLDMLLNTQSSYWWFDMLLGSCDITVMIAIILKLCDDCETIYLMPLYFMPSVWQYASKFLWLVSHEDSGCCYCGVTDISATDFTNKLWKLWDVCSPGGNISIT